jgi:hypothetical protein
LAFRDEETQKSAHQGITAAAAQTGRPQIDRTFASIGMTGYESIASVQVCGIYAVSSRSQDAQ